MIDDPNQLAETFAAHEHLAPDAAAVLAKANGIARSMHRRRWAVRATGGAVLGAGLVAGGIALPGRAGHSATESVTTNPLHAAADPTATPATYTVDQEFNAFFAAGYTYDDAVQLAQLWNDGNNTSQAKSDAGEKLLEGQTLPIPPSGQPESPAEKGVSAFFAAGYTYDDAVQLGKIWHETNTYQVKGEAGQKLIDGQTLPIPPSGSSHPGGATATLDSSLLARKEKLAGANTIRAGGRTLIVPTHGGAITPADSGESPADAAYFDAGYDYSDAVQLAKIWNETDITHVKAEAGQKLLDGQKLPIPPSEPQPPPNKAVTAFFAAGYTYDDAVRLGRLWHESNTYHVKAQAGQKLIDGQTLPIAP